MKKLVYNKKVPNFPSTERRNAWISVQAEQYSYAAIGRALNISRQRIHQIDSRNKKRAETVVSVD